ncbi:hypothetical protein [Pseudomonas chlororaphis]|uniref:hypothetical protein n=1 Tax=Pseudomonas chlororaphis TaxID=587753 RepID=UPI0012D3544A|nr:hypothetical protein [Pseudomonas chlororaphis]
MKKNRSLFAVLTTLLGMLFMVLAISFIFSLFIVFVLAVTIDRDFNKVFLFSGLPLTLVMTFVWIWRNSGSIKRIINGEG